MMGISKQEELFRLMNFFAVGERDLNAVVAAALKGGAQWADLYFEHLRTRSLSLSDSQVSSAVSQIDYGVGIRALCGDRTGYSYSQSTRLEDMLRAASVAGSIAGACSGSVSPVNILPCSAPTSYAGGAPCLGPMSFEAPCSAPTSYAGVTPFPGKLYGASSLWDSTPVESFVTLLMELERRIRARDSRVVKVQASIASSLDEILMYNSLGEMCADCRPMCTLSARIVFSSGKVTENRNVSRSFRKGAEMLTPELLEEVVANLCGGIDEMLEARRPKGGRMSVVMGAGASGILLHEAMGHAFEADFNRKGQSVFSDMMGKRVCPKGINIVDDATVPCNRGALMFDDEGVPGQKTYMVTDGVLTSYLHDRISAAHYGVAPTGNGRRESYRCNPIPRMRLTYMESGSSSCADLISSLEKGLYVDEFSNGQVKIGEGDFTFYVKKGYLIENGRLTMPVKDVNIIGNGPEALRGIRAVGNDLKIDNSCWICGKEQSVAVSCGMPSVLVDELTVGGE